MWQLEALIYAVKFRFCINVNEKRYLFFRMAEADRDASLLRWNFICLKLIYFFASFIHLLFAWKLSANLQVCMHSCGVSKFFYFFSCFINSLFKLFSNIIYNIIIANWGRLSVHYFDFYNLIFIGEFLKVFRGISWVSSTNACSRSCVSTIFLYTQWKKGYTALE